MTTPGSDLVKILIGTQAPPQSVAESLELALNVALDMLPGGKAFKAFKGSGGQLLLNKLKQQIKRQAGKVAGKMGNGATKGLIKLTKKGREKLGTLIDLKDRTAREALKARGGSTSATHMGRCDYREKTLKEVANLAGAGDKEADTMMKLIKKAKTYAGKYGGK